jgi:hypothetical protein
MSAGHAPERWSAEEVKSIFKENAHGDFGNRDPMDPGEMTVGKKTSAEKTPRMDGAGLQGRPDRIFRAVTQRGDQRGETEKRRERRPAPDSRPPLWIPDYMHCNKYSIKLPQ